MIVKVHSIATIAGRLLAGLVATLAMAQQATVTESTDVRTGATADSLVRGTLDKGEIVVIELRSGGWCSVRRAEPPLVGFVACGTLESAPPAARSVFQQSRAPSIDDLIRASGFDAYFRQLTDPNMLKEALARDGKNKELTAEILAVMSKSFDAETFLGPMRSALEKGHSEKFANAVLAWYASDAGKRVSSAEAEAVFTGSPAEFRQFARQLQSNPPSPTRLALTERLRRTADTLDLQLEVAASVTRSIAKLVNPRLPPGKRLSEKALDQLAGQMQQLRPLFEQAAKIRFLYLYRNLTDADLERYVEFWETPQGRWLRQGMSEGAVEGVRTFTVEFVRAMIELEEQRKRR